MPLDVSRGAPPRHPGLQPSAAIELTWLITSCGPAEGQFLADHPELRNQTAAFWGDGAEMLFEPMICAQQLGCLYGWDIEPLFHLERSALTVPAGLTLETEWPDEREIIVNRVRRLSQDQALRKRYSALLRAVWNAAEPSWNDVGRAAVERATARLQAAIDHGVRPLDLPPEGHCAHKDIFSAITRRGEESGSLVVTPSYFAGERGHIIALPGVLSIAIGTGVTHDMARRRADAERVAGGLKLLSDPTRLLILNELDREPMSVGETAKRVGVAQPTASVHLRQLRDAGLLQSTRHGGKTVFQVRHERIRQLLDDANGTLPRAG